MQDLPKCAFANFKTSIGSAENNNGCSKILKNIKNMNNNNKKSRDSKLNPLIFYECASFITTNCFYICIRIRRKFTPKNHVFYNESQPQSTIFVSHILFLKELTLRSISLSI